MTEFSVRRFADRLLWRRSLPRFERRIVGVALIGALCLACSRAPEPEPSTGVVALGVVGPFSGPLQETSGRHLRAGADLAARRVADEGLEIDGRAYRLELVYHDSQDSPETVVEVVRTLAADSDVAAFIGPTISRNALVAAAAAEHADLPMMTTTATHPDVTRGRSKVFRLPFTDDFQGRALARFAVRDLGKERLAALYDVTSAYNSYLAETFREQAERLGASAVAWEGYASGETDYRPYLERIRRAGADLIFLPNYVDELPDQAAQIRELGLDIEILGGDSWDANLLPQHPGFEGAYYADAWDALLQDPASRRFTTAYEEAYGSTPRSPDAHAYDAVLIAVEALRAAASAERSDFVEGLRSLRNYEGVTGTFDWRSSNDPEKPLQIFRILGGGIVYDREVSSAGD